MKGHENSTRIPVGRKQMSTKLFYVQKRQLRENFKKYKVDLFKNYFLEKSDDQGIPFRSKDSYFYKHLHTNNTDVFQNV